MKLVKNTIGKLYKRIKTSLKNAKEEHIIANYLKENTLKIQKKLN